MGRELPLRAFLAPRHNRPAAFLTMTPATSSGYSTSP